MAFLLQQSSWIKIPKLLSSIYFAHGIITFHVTFSIQFTLSLLLSPHILRSVIYICFSITVLIIISSAPSFYILYMYVSICIYFPQFILIHTVKGFGIVNIAEIDVFLELSCFFHDPVDVGNLVPLPFLKPAWTSGSSWFTYCWSLAWRILSITLLACEMSAIVQ